MFCYLTSMLRQDIGWKLEKKRTWLKEKGLNKPPGISWIVVSSQVHYFTAGDMSHLQSDKIYANLNSLLSTIKENGYVPDLCWISHDEGEYG